MRFTIYEKACTDAKKMLCYVFGGIGKELYIMSCCTVVKRLLRTSAINN